MTTTAILTAAGSGSRLGADLPKALVPINGVPMVRIAAQNLLKSGVIDELIITVPAGYLEQFAAALNIEETLGIDQLGQGQSITYVTGGATRQASISQALKQLSPSCHKVLVHDAARPFTPPELIAKVANRVDAESTEKDIGYGIPVRAAIPALPVTDTIKQVNSEGFATNVDRTFLYAAQTPQAFERQTLARAYAAAEERGEHYAATDDASLVEQINVIVHVLEGEEAAMKITTPTDLKIAALLYGGQT